MDYLTISSPTEWRYSPQTYGWNHREIRNWTETQHGIPSTNGWANRRDQCHIGTISTGIHQLSTGRLVWLHTTSRICIKQRISGNHQEHTLLCKLRNQPRIWDDRSSDTRKTNKTRRNDLLTWVINKRNGGRAVTASRVVAGTDSVMILSLYQRAVYNETKYRRLRPSYRNKHLTISQLPSSS